MVYAKPESVLGNETHKEILRYKRISVRPENQQRQKGSCLLVDIAALAGHWEKIKECENRNEYLNLTRKLKRSQAWLWYITYRFCA